MCENLKTQNQNVCYLSVRIYDKYFSLMKECTFHNVILFLYEMINSDKYYYKFNDINHYCFIYIGNIILNLNNKFFLIINDDLCKNFILNNKSFFSFQILYCGFKDYIPSIIFLQKNFNESKLLYKKLFYDFFVYRKNNISSYIGYKKLMFRIHELESIKIELLSVQRKCEKKANAFRFGKKIRLVLIMMVIASMFFAVSFFNNSIKERKILELQKEKDAITNYMPYLIDVQNILDPSNIYKRLATNDFDISPPSIEVKGLFLLSRLYKKKSNNLEYVRVLEILNKDFQYLPAIFDLALYYKDADMPERDLLYSLSLMRKAASLGHKKAMYHMGIFYSKGLGVPKNTELSRFWFSVGALYQEEKSLYNAGILSSYGKGGPKNLVQSYFFLKKLGLLHPDRVQYSLALNKVQDQLGSFERKVAQYAVENFDLFKTPSHFQEVSIKLDNLKPHEETDLYLQIGLTLLGYDVANINGIYDQRLEKAILQYYQDHQLGEYRGRIDIEPFRSHLKERVNRYFARKPILDLK